MSSDGLVMTSDDEQGNTLLKPSSRVQLGAQ